GPEIRRGARGGGDRAGRWAGARRGPRAPGEADSTSAQDEGNSAAAAPAAEAGLLPWRLDAPLSREVVLPRGGARRGLVVLGGLRSGDSSTNAVEALDTRTGALSPRGSLIGATHDAAGTTLGKQLLVIGGGTTAPAGSTQIQTGERTTAGGALPEARADA